MRDEVSTLLENIIDEAIICIGRLLDALQITDLINAIEKDINVLLSVRGKR